MPPRSSRGRGKADRNDSGDGNGNGDIWTSGGEFQSGPPAGTAIFDAANVFRKAVVYAEVDGWAIFEGDIAIARMDELERMQSTGRSVLESIGITGQQFRWPNAQLPFEIDGGLPNQQRVLDAVAHWEANTRIRFVQVTAANTTQFTDRVRFVAGGGCSSQVGRRGGVQDITLGGGCSTGNAIHEIGHSLGLFHEQSREDRDTFVQIVFANIDPAAQHNFLQHIQDADDLGPYDYGSIMHYPPTAFSINGQATIIALQPLPPGVVMGQRNGLSQGDINGIHQMYPAPKIPIKDGPKDPLKDTHKEPLKDPPKEPIKEFPKEPIKEPIKDPFKDPIKDIRKDPPKEFPKDGPKDIPKDPPKDPPKDIPKDPPKEFPKDPPKEFAKEPIKEFVKDVVKDPPKEPFREKLIPREPIEQPGQPGMPFTLGGATQFAAQDAASALAAHMEQLAGALAAVEVIRTVLTTQYEAAVAQSQALGGQGG